MDISMIMAIPVLPSAPINYGDDCGAPAGQRRRPRGSRRPAATSVALRLAGGDVRAAPAGQRRRQVS